MGRFPPRDRGASLIDVLVAIFVLAVVTVAVTGLGALTTRTAIEGERQTVALAIANEQIEVARSLPYDQVGSNGDNPNGVLKGSEVVARNQQSYTRETQVVWVDDPLTPTPNDYKKIKVKVSWATAQGSGTTRDVNLVTYVVPGSNTGTSTTGTTTASATILGPDGSVIGLVGPDGSIVGPNGSVIGTYTSTGTTTGTTSGTTTGISNGTATNATGTSTANGPSTGASSSTSGSGTIGVAGVGPGSTVISSSGVTLGVVGPDGTSIVGPNGAVVGTLTSSGSGTQSSIGISSASSGNSTTNGTSSGTNTSSTASGTTNGTGNGTNGTASGTTNGTSSTASSTTASGTTAGTGSSTGTSTGGTCPNTICDPSESCVTCPQDCGQCTTITGPTGSGSGPGSGTGGVWVCNKNQCVSGANCPATEYSSCQTIFTEGGSVCGRFQTSHPCDNGNWLNCGGGTNCVTNTQSGEMCCGIGGCLGRPSCQESTNCPDGSAKVCKSLVQPQPFSDCIFDPQNGTCSDP